MLLDGMKIVSFCHFLQGPAAMQYLGDMGAEIIKIEPPQGAYERHWAGAGGAKVNGVSAFYLAANRNARSIAIDLKKPDARDVVFRLVGQAHAVAENFRPGALDRLGLGYDAVRARKPDIIYASASGYGSTGPYARRPGQDLLIQAMSGLVSANGGGPARSTAIGCAAVDQHGGALLAIGILGAYVKWLRTGEGTRVEASLLGAGIDLQIESLVTYYAAAMGDHAFERQENLATWFHEAPYGVYPVADGHMAISLNPLEKLARALDTDVFAPFLGGDPFAERDAIAALVAAELKDRRFADLAAAFEAEAMWYARVETFDDLPENPQLVHNGTFGEIEVDGARARIVNHPNRYDGQCPDRRHFALRQGADTRAILEEAGFAATEIAELLKGGVVHAPV
ncbi:MAG: CaiB/BaiF CoA-transferase family protein [Alphaproteobacteria bacterium]